MLVTCDETNTASASVIERCGGVLEDVRALEDGTAKRRYWIHDDVGLTRLADSAS